MPSEIHSTLSRSRSVTYVYVARIHSREYNIGRRPCNTRSTCAHVNIELTFIIYTLLKFPQCDDQPSVSHSLVVGFHVRCRLHALRCLTCSYTFISGARKYSAALKQRAGVSGSLVFRDICVRGGRLWMFIIASSLFLFSFFQLVSYSCINCCIRLLVTCLI